MGAESDPNVGLGSATEDERFRKRKVLIGEAGLESAVTGNETISRR